MIPGVIVAGTHSGVGKTTVAMGLMSLLVKAGYQVQGFKVGPDYIDPSFHQGITGRSSENLDSWMTSPEEVRRIYFETAKDADLAVVEGVMGLFDGAAGETELGSTAHIAKILGLPVILVIDVRSMAQSVAAVIKGFTEFNREIRFGGIILNRVGSSKHSNILSEAIKNVTPIKVLGHLSRDMQLSLPERHLGLVPFYEHPEFGQKLSKFAEIFQTQINIDLLLKVFQPPSFLSHDIHSSLIYLEERLSDPVLAEKVRIGVAVDEAFGFYYQDNFRLLEHFGAELVRFSPLLDKKLPDNLDGIYIGGGYPEIFAAQLAANDVFKADLRKTVLKGLPTYAECGGLMYMTKSIHTAEGQFPMLDLIDIEVEMMPRREVLGYIEVEAIVDNLLLKKGQKARGHEFHYSKIVKPNSTDQAYLIQKDGVLRREGFARKNILGSYVHLHFASNPELAKNFVDKCRDYNRIRNIQGICIQK